MNKDLARIPSSERDSSSFHSIPTPVPILQREWEFAEFLKLARVIKPIRILEAGTHSGGSLFHFMQLAGQHIRLAGTNCSAGTVVSVDSYATTVDNLHLYEGWKPPGTHLYALAGDSHDPAIIAEVERLGPYDVIFLDAGHKEHEIQADWDNFHGMAVSGGIVALHDILPPSPEWPDIQVDRVWARIRRLGYVTQELIGAETFPGRNPPHDWGGIGICWAP